MKKSLIFLIPFLLLTACSDASDTSTSAEQKAPQPDAVTGDEIYSFDINTLEPGCNSDSMMICAINLSIKCTINPQFSECAENTKFMPKFVFMEDDSLQRPSSQSYKITKLKPLPDDTVEVYTQSTCNGNWFGLCNGNIIYVMKMQDGRWSVKDIYAVES